MAPIVLDKNTYNDFKDINYKERASPCHADYFYRLHSSPFFILLTCSTPVMHAFASIVETVDPDQDLQCFKNMTNPGFSKTNFVKCNYNNIHTLGVLFVPVLV